MSIAIPAYQWQQDCFQALEDPDIDYVCALGTRGPGKSWFSRNANIVRCLQMPGTDHIIFRKTSDDIVKQYAATMKATLNDFHGGRIPHIYNGQYKVFTINCPGGGTSRLFLGFCEKDAHAEKHQSFEYSTVTYDECTHIRTKHKDLINVSVRGRNNLKRIYLGNPGGIDHTATRADFIRPKTRRPKTFVVQPKISDNKWLKKNDPGYIDRITAGLPAWKVSQWRDGDWETSEGSYFAVPFGAIQEVRIPPWAKCYAGADWGYFPAAFAVVWFATWVERDGRHRIHVFKSLKQRKLTDPAQAEAALETEKGFSHPIAVRFGDPMMNKKDTSGPSDPVARSTRLTWQRNGWVVHPGKYRARVPGWSLLREFLQIRPGYVTDGEPHGEMTIDPGCDEFYNELMDVQSDPTSEDFISHPGEDDCLDGFRYGLTMVYNMKHPDRTSDAYDRLPVPRKVA